MWNPTTRRHQGRTGLRYASDLTDTEWALLEPLLPPPCDQGRPRARPMRELVNAILYVTRSGCPLRLLLREFPPWRTVHRWFAAWRDEVTVGGRVESIKAEAIRYAGGLVYRRSGASVAAVPV